MNTGLSFIVFRKIICVFTVAVICFTPFTVADIFAQTDIYIYPKKGQSDEQLEKDKYECYVWAKKQSGFDPLEPPKATSATPSKETPQGDVVRGAARGALVGTVTGAITGDAGTGAAVGAASGGLFGAMRRRDRVRQNKAASKQRAEQQILQKRSEYNRAVSACLEARDYTVK